MWFFLLIVYTTWSQPWLPPKEVKSNTYAVICDNLAQIKMVIDTNQIISGCRFANRFRNVSPNELYVTSDSQVMLIMTTEVVAIERIADTDWVIRLSGYVFMNVTANQHDT